MTDQTTDYNYEDDEDYEDGDLDELNCTFCGGEGWEFCEDWDCWEANCDGDAHDCGACRGTGKRSEQWIF